MSDYERRIAAVRAVEMLRFRGFIYDNGEDYQHQPRHILSIALTFHFQIITKNFVVIVNFTHGSIFDM